jgi:hypothetical protein
MSAVPSREYVAHNYRGLASRLEGIAERHQSDPIVRADLERSARHLRELADIIAPPYATGLRLTPALES